jgi:hypothetical protein
MVDSADSVSSNAPLDTDLVESSIREMVVDMRRVGGSRSSHPDLLTGRSRDEPPEDRWATLLIDPAAQVAALADLVDRGLVSPDEFERQRGKIFGA